MIERATATAFERTTEATATAAAPADASLATLPKITSDVEVEVNAEFVQSKTDSMTELPPLDLRGLERKQSASTSSSSSSPVDDSDASSDDLDDVDDIRAYADDREAAGEQFLVKPMSSLPVCPFDDLAVEDEKRRRRSVRLMKKDKSHRTHCPDAESLPSPSSQLTPKPRRFTTSQVAPGGDVARPPLSAPTLRRDSMAIRQQYWKQLGLSMSRRDLERNTGKRRERHVGLKVQLNDARAKKDSSKSIFQIIASWYASDEDKEEKEASLAASDTDSATDSSMSPRRKGIRFNEEAELFYIPLHKDYSKRQRDCMWHSRAEFISMVERNLEEVYEEMEREYEEQCHAEMLENEAMAKEEARQRLFEAQMQARAAKAAEVAAAARASPPQQRTASPSPVSSPPMLALCPTQIKVTPRARSPHDLRFKYLKHLGIDK